MSERDLQRIRLAQSLHEIWSVWSRLHLRDGKPVTKLEVLCSPSLRQQFVEAVFTVCSCEWKHPLAKRLDEQFVLQDLVGLDRGATIVTDDDLDLLMKLAPHAAEVVDMTRASNEELAS